MTVPTGNFPIFHSEWYLADSEYGWYVVSPWGGQCGPFTEEEGAAKMAELRAFPVWCPACLVPMKQYCRPRGSLNEPPVQRWYCHDCGLSIEQDEIARIIKVNE